MTNAPESLFDALSTEAALQQVVEDQREEGLHLEFKEKADPSHGNLDREDTAGFSKTVSGFANADGGALIFGVATTKSADNPDRARELKAITNPERFRAKLLDSIPNVTQPPVDGIRLEVIAGSSGTGFVRCLVPASDRAPHRAMQAQREYWRRTGNGNRRMEHYELEDAFGRRLRPVLRIGVTLRPQADHEELHFVFRNVGRGLARHSGFVCHIGQGRIIDTEGGVHDATQDQEAWVMHYDPQNVVHPNGIFKALGFALIQRPETGAPLPLTVRWYAEDMAPRQESIEVEPHNRLMMLPPGEPMTPDMLGNLYL